MKLSSLISRLLPKRSYGLNGLDLKLRQNILPKKNGFFIEAGANDGINQSNTYLLEKKFGWKGLLIEPIPSLYNKCLQNRGARNFVENYALSSEDGGTVEMRDFNLYSYVQSENPSVEEKDHEAAAMRKYKHSGPVSLIPKIRLSTLIDTFNSKHGNSIGHIDLLSLDVERYELEVLKGLDLSRHRPRYMLIEGGDRPEILDYLKKYYRKVASLTPSDVLFQCNDGVVAGE